MQMREAPRGTPQFVWVPMNALAPSTQKDAQRPYKDENDEELLLTVRNMQGSSGAPRCSPSAFEPQSHYQGACTRPERQRAQLYTKRNAHDSCQEEGSWTCVGSSEAHAESAPHPLGRRTATVRLGWQTLAAVHQLYFSWNYF